MTVVILGTSEVPRVAELAACLRRRGFNVLELESLTVIALVMVTERVASLVVFEQYAPADWASSRERLAEISPRTSILFLPTVDVRTPEQLAVEALRDIEE